MFSKIELRHVIWAVLIGKVFIISIVFLEWGAFQRSIGKTIVTKTEMTEEQWKKINEHKKMVDSIQQIIRQDSISQAQKKDSQSVIKTKKVHNLKSKTP